MKVAIEEIIHDKFMELRNLGIITHYDTSTTMVYINRDKLAEMLGYTLVTNVGDYECSEPVFKRLNDINYSLNVSLYLSDIVPFSSLKTYVLTELRDSIISG